MTSNLTAKMQKVFELETEVEVAQHNQRQATREATVQQEQLQVELANWKRDCRAAQQLVEELRADVVERDRRLSRHQEEGAQHKAVVGRHEQRVQEMGAQLARAEEALAQMLKSNTYKDQLLREMTEMVNVSETKLHSYQINELISSRQTREGPVPDSPQLEASPPRSEIIRNQPAAVLRSPSTLEQEVEE